MGEPVDINSYGWMHIYAQRSWHEDAVIRGNSVALRNLRDAIDKALIAGEARSEATAIDGEGYNVLVQRTEVIDLIGSLPYTDDLAAGRLQKWKDR